MDKKDFPERDDFDTCVNWIAAKAIKSRLLLYAASPLFNGNSEYYADFKSKLDGRNLISQTYDEKKWQRAAIAAREAIDAATAAGYALYTDPSVSKSKFEMPYLSPL